MSLHLLQHEIKICRIPHFGILSLGQLVLVNMIRLYHVSETQIDDEVLVIKSPDIFPSALPWNWVMQRNELYEAGDCQSSFLFYHGWSMQFQNQLLLTACQDILQPVSAYTLKLSPCIKGYLFLLGVTLGTMLQWERKTGFLCFRGWCSQSFSDFHACENPLGALLKTSILGLSPQSFWLNRSWVGTTDMPC